VVIVIGIVTLPLGYIFKVRLNPPSVTPYIIATIILWFIIIFIHNKIFDNPYSIIGMLLLIGANRIAYSTVRMDLHNPHADKFKSKVILDSFTGELIGLLVWFILLLFI